MKKILIIDNIKAYRNTLKRAIETHGLPTLEILHEKEFFSLDYNDLMLVLIADKLATHDAFELLEQTKKDPRTKSIPFMLCSSLEDPTYITKAIKAGLKDVILRPYNRRMVFQTIKNYLIEANIIDKNMFMRDEHAGKIQKEEKIDFLKEVIAMAPEEIKPIYNPTVNTGYFYPDVSEYFAITPGEGFSILRELYEENIISRSLVDKVSLCPTCNYHTINFREICPKCNSLDIKLEAIYHHFTCGYIGPVSDFKTSIPNQMQCPKCEKLLRHIGLDYEKPSDTFICEKCNYICTEPKVEFYCFYCGIVAPAEEVVVSNIYSYSANKKTEKIVEYRSFSAFDIKEVLENDNNGQFSWDFFNYMLKLKYKEHIEFGDAIIVSIISMNNDPGGIKELTTYLAETTSGTDLIYKKNDNTLVYVSSRRPREKIEEESNHIVNFTCLLADKDQTTTTTITAKIFIREFKDSIHNIDNFIDSTYQIFEQEQANITDGVTVYEK